MKPAFFLVLCCLVFLRVYFKNWWPGPHAPGEVSITMQNGDDYEQVRYGGKIVLSPGDSSIETMEPGAYIRYRHNNHRFVADANIKGQIIFGSAGTAYQAEAIRAMVAFGFDTKARMERLFAKGGDSALAAALPQLKSSDAYNLYIRQLLRKKQVTDDVLNAILQLANRLPADIDKRKIIELVINNVQLKANQWLLVEQAIAQIQSPPDRSALLMLAQQKQQHK